MSEFSHSRVAKKISLLVCASFLLSSCHSLYKRPGSLPSKGSGVGSTETRESSDPKNSTLDRNSVGSAEKESSSKFNIPESDLVEHDPEDWNEEGPELKFKSRGSRPQFDWPVDEARLTRGFSAKPIRTKRSRKKRPHLGLDLAAPKGTPILAAHDGTVIYVGKGFKGYGNLIVVEDPKGWATLYAHLHQSYVRQGQRVLQGERIGSMGKTGRAFGVHLHFEIRTLAGPVDPLDFLPQGVQVRSQLEAKSSGH